MTRLSSAIWRRWESLLPACRRWVLVLLSTCWGAGLHQLCFSCTRGSVAQTQASSRAACVMENRAYLVPSVLSQLCYHMLKHSCRELRWARQRFMKHISFINKYKRAREWLKKVCKGIFANKWVWACLDRRICNLWRTHLGTAPLFTEKAVGLDKIS